MDALTATKPGVFVIAIKTIPTLYHLTNQPRQKFKLALKVSVGDKTGLTDFVISRRATGRATDEPTDQPSPNRRGIKPGTGNTRKNKFSRNKSRTSTYPARKGGPH